MCFTRMGCIIISCLHGTKDDPGAIEVANKTKGNELQT